jgi:hypothetical protein
MRRKVWIRIAILLILGAGLILLGASMVSPSRITPYPPGEREPAGPESERRIGEIRWKDVRLFQESSWIATFLISLGTAMATVSVVDFLVAFGERHFRERDEAKFEQFFGPGSLSSREPGHIILQADRIDDLMETLLKDAPEVASAVAEKLSSPSSNRLYKARTWVNARDTEAAREIRENFRKDGFPAPELVIVDHNNPGKHADAPYVISMGLAFTDETKELIKKVGGDDKWMYIDSDTKMGDTIVLDGHVIHAAFHELDAIPIDEKSAYRRMFPKPWDPKVWLKGEPSKDYAIVLRHRESQGRNSQTRFVLAGFTEDGTAAAGRYFAAHWVRLWERYVKGKADGGGNFLVVISGESHSKDTWTQNPVTITKEDLRGVKCPWTD